MFNLADIRTRFANIYAARSLDHNDWRNEVSRIFTGHITTGYINWKVKSQMELSRNLFYLNYEVYSFTNTTNAKTIGTASTCFAIPGRTFRSGNQNEIHVSIKTLKACLNDQNYFNNLLQLEFTRDGIPSYNNHRFCRDYRYNIRSYF